MKQPDKRHGWILHVHAFSKAQAEELAEIMRQKVLGAVRNDI